MGVPFGFQKLRMWLIPKGFGIAGEIGVFALDAIVAGLIGGLFLIKKLIIIIADYFRAVIAAPNLIQKGHTDADSIYMKAMALHNIKEVIFQCLLLDDVKEEDGMIVASLYTIYVLE